METTLFYVFGIVLVASALVVSVLGLRSETFPSRAAFRLGIALFAILVGATATFAVLNARDEQTKRNEKLAAAETKTAAEPASEKAKPSGEPGPEGTKQTLTVVADESQLAWKPTKLSAAVGGVMIKLDNPSPIQHDVVIEQDGTEVAKSELVTQGTTSASAQLDPGTYTYFCDVPGHADAGMTGTLTVK